MLLETALYCQGRVVKAIGARIGQSAAKRGQVSKNLRSARVAEALHDAQVTFGDGTPQRSISTDIVKATQLGPAPLEQELDDFCLSPESRQV